jgi:hypothetical protein
VNARVLVAGLMAIAVLTVAASLYFRAAVPPFDKSSSSVLSPDARLKALRLVVTRQSPPAYCDASVSIYLAGYPESFAETEKGYVVYAAPGATPADLATLPEVQWLGNDSLQIAYTPGPTADDASKLRRRVSATRAAYRRAGFVPS